MVDMSPSIGNCMIALFNVKVVDKGFCLGNKRWLLSTVAAVSAAAFLQFKKKSVYLIMLLWFQL